MDKFAATVQGGGKRESTTTSQTESHAKTKHDDELQASYPEILVHFKLEDKDPETNYAELQKYVRLKYCRKVALPKKDQGVANELNMHEGLLK